MERIMEGYILLIYVYFRHWHSMVCQVIPIFGSTLTSNEREFTRPVEA